MSKAVKVIKDYEEFVTSKGQKLKVFAVPSQIIKGITPETPKPHKPVVTMEIKVGGKVKEQVRPVKETDPEWAEYQQQLEEWEDERDALQEAVTYCLALKEVEVPADPQVSDFSEGVRMMYNTGLLKLPTNVWERKYLWLQDSTIGQHDEYNINMIIYKLSGIPEDIIDEMKANFRNTLLGKDTGELAESDSN